MIERRIAQANTNVFISDLVEVELVDGLGLRFIGHEATVRNAIVFIGPCHHILLVDFLGPPANDGHAVLERPDRQLLGKPEFDESIDMFRLQRPVHQTTIAKFMELVGYQGQMRSRANLSGITALAAVATDFFQLVVQVSHKCSRYLFSVSDHLTAVADKSAGTKRSWDTTPIRPEYAWSEATWFFLG